MKTLRKNILREFKSSFPRFISITILLALGAFILIGLKVTGDDMRQTGDDYFKEHHMAHAQVTSPIGFDKDDKNYIKHMKHVDKTEFSIYKDAIISNSDTAIRLNEKTEDLSTYKAKEGRLPTKSNEIALSEQDTSKYHIGDIITLTNNDGDKDVSGLKHSKYKVVGFVTSSDYMQKRDLGVTSAGKGQIDTFGVLAKSAFSTTKANVAKITYDNVKSQAYSDQFEKQINKNVAQNEKNLMDWSDKQVSQLKEDKQSELDKSKKKLDQQKEALKENEAILKQTGQYKEKQQDISQAEQKLKNKESEIKKLNDVHFSIKSRSDYNQGYSQFGESAKRIDVLSNTFPIIFFAVAILVTFITMSRMAEEKRTNMGLMRALGYSKFDTMKVFLIYGTSAAIIGTVVGSFFGTWLLPQRIYQAYAANLVVPAIQTPAHWLWIIISFILALLCTVVPSMVIAWKALKEKPKYLLLPKPPKAGSKILLERIPFIWKRMSFNKKVTARNLFRYKGRMLMTIFGVFGCTALLITGFGMRDSLNGIIDNQYKDIIHYDVIGVYNPNASQHDKDAYEKKISDMKGVKAQDDMYYEAVTAKPKNVIDNQQITMMIPKHTDNFSKFMTLKNYDTGKQMNLSDNGAIITEKLAKLGHYKVGDNITIKDNASKTHKVKIDGITQMYAGHHMIMNPTYYEKVFDNKVNYNAKIINLSDRSASNINNVSKELNSQDAAQTAIQSNQAKTAINTILDGLDNIVLIIVVASSALSFVVLFTLTNINVSERTRELATLRVLGFYKKETVMYIYRETILLTIVGILVGFIGGYYLHHFIMSTLPPNNAMADMTLYWTNFGLSTVLTLVFAFIVMLIMARKISKTDMLSALNSVE
ncbi:ABC transporter permease [Staphylococcus sp. Marseille-Q1834]|uniref:ABC transporter permease n=1 Tax=Staphylococcus sp. Marseille-Q1834 TaxID=2866594 RepID=UPI001CF91339|nr:ABC transporter permease [Staphylococcus sp. Marseille-Q1834]